MFVLAGDVRRAARALLQSPGFTLVAVLTLALSIGANTAIFSFVNAVMLSPLPFDDPDRLVVVRAIDQGRSYLGPSPPDGLDYARRNHTFEHLALFDYWRKNVSGIDNMQPEEMLVGLTPGDYFETLGIKPIMGRLFTADENEFGRHHVAIVSESFWRRRFGADPRALGRTLRINDESYSIVGVIPDAIPLWMAQLAGMQAHIWTPLAPYANFFDETSRGGRGVDNIGRLKPGVRIEEAQADLDVIAQQLAAEYPVDRGAGVSVRRLADERAGPVRSALLLLLGAVGLILLIACANVANLLLVRNSRQRRDFAVRAALGGGRHDLIRQPLVESALLAAAGGGAGVLIATIGARLMLQLRPDRFPQLATAAIDGRVLLFTLLVSLAITIAFGLAPILTVSRIDVVGALKDGGRGSTAGVRARGARRVLVMGEVALSLMLMIVAGLLVRSVGRLQAQELGFRADHLLHAHLYLPPARYPDSASLTRFVDAFADRVRSLPGVRASSITSLVPPSNRWDQVLTIPGEPVAPGQALPTVGFGVADEHLLSTLGIPLLRGRNFAATDTPTEPTVALVSQSLARKFFRGGDPIGTRVHLGDPGVTPVAGSSRASMDATIVGVIGDVRNRGVGNPPEPQLIVLYRQAPALNFGFKELIVRTTQDPNAIVAAVANQLRRMDPDMPLAEVSPVNELISRQTSDRRFTTTLLTLFAVLGVVLATVGVYGVVSYVAAERTHEIGVRVALGARRRDVLWLVMRPALAMAGVGAALGLSGAWTLRRLLDTLVFGISTADPMTYGGGSLLLLATVLAAALVPAWRATRVDPIVTLRFE